MSPAVVIDISASAVAALLLVLAAARLGIVRIVIGRPIRKPEVKS